MLSLHRPIVSITHCRVVLLLQELCFDRRAECELQAWAECHHWREWSWQICSSGSPRAGTQYCMECQQYLCWLALMHASMHQRQSVLLLAL